MRSSKSGSGERGSMISKDAIKRIQKHNSTYSRKYIVEKDQDFTAAVSRLKRSRVNLNIPIVPETEERKPIKATI